MDLLPCKSTRKSVSFLPIFNFLPAYDLFASCFQFLNAFWFHKIWPLTVSRHKILNFTEIVLEKSAGNFILVVFFFCMSAACSKFRR